jgi:L-serine dehydratase
MQLAIREGLQRSGNLPGKLNYPRKAKKVHSIDIDSRYSQSRFIRSDNKLMSFAYACSEQNASGGVIVTAPTCGACGVLPSILLKAKHDLHIADKKIVEALAIAGLVGNITRTNASIAGAEAGCQAEIGVACAMAAAAYTYILDQPDRKIMNAATNALEHHLGLTCDPVLGYVQVPCIERNVFAASRAVTATHLAMLNDENQM